MITTFKKKKAIEAYVHILPVLLKKKHGKKKQYTREQIEELVSSMKLDQKYIDYALALFMSKKSFTSTLRVALRIW